MKLRDKKTGEIVDWDGIHITSDNDGEMFDSIAELNEAWEDYKPAEPLIRDEKVRRAVRAWAEANNSTKMVFDGYHLASDEHGNDIEFSNSWAENVKHGEWYTIAELCGEEDGKEDEDSEEQRADEH